MRSIQIWALTLGVAAVGASYGTEARTGQAKMDFDLPWVVEPYGWTIPEAELNGPAFDLDKNPGCRVTGLTREQKIKRNAKIARYYYEMSAQQVKLNYKYTLADHGCDALDATWLYGTFTPPPAKPKPVYIPPNPKGPGPEFSSAETENVIQGEFRAIVKVLPDFAAVPGTLRVIPWDGGVNLSMMYAGTTKDGERLTCWEMVTMLVNDEGLITHYEAWNDPIGAEKIMLLAYGHSFQDVGFGQYWQMIDEATKDAKDAKD